MTQIPEKLFYSTIRRAAISGGPLSGMAATIVQFYPPPVEALGADTPVAQPCPHVEAASRRSFIPPGSTPQARSAADAVSAVRASLVIDGADPAVSIGVLCLRLDRIKGLKQGVLEILAHSTLPPFRVLLVEAPEYMPVNADFLRTLRNSCPSGRMIAWTTTCAVYSCGRGYETTSWYVTAKSLASFTRHGFLHNVKFLSSGADGEFDHIVSCIAALNVATARSDLPPIDPLTVYVAPNKPYDSYVSMSVQYRCLRYGYSYAPM